MIRQFLVLAKLWCVSAPNGAHPFTALSWRERNGALTMATHNKALGIAARAVGLKVVGV